MSIGPDIKEALEEVGTSISIVSGEVPTTLVSDGYISTKPNAQVTKPFIREFFLEGMMSYDAAAVVGDIVKFTTTSDYYMIMNKTPELFEDVIFRYSSVLYKANVTAGILLRESGEVYDSDYQRAIAFTPVRTECFALATEPLFGGGLDQDEDLGLLGIERHELYIPRKYGIQLKDRFQLVSGEYYMITDIKRRRFDGIDVAILEEDHR